MTEDTKPTAQVINLGEYKARKVQERPADLDHGSPPITAPGAIPRFGRAWTLIVDDLSDELRQPADPERLKTRPLAEYIPRANITDEQAQRFNKAMREMLRNNRPEVWYASLLRPLPEPEQPTEIAGPSLSFIITDEPKDPDPSEP